MGLSVHASLGACVCLLVPVGLSVHVYASRGLVCVADWQLLLSILGMLENIWTTPI